jgi:hypothetical protein
LVATLLFTVATGFLPDFKMFFDNNFLFFVTVTATLDDSRRSSIKILKEEHIIQKNPLEYIAIKF